MPELSPKSLKCPICMRDFESQLVIGYRVGEKEADFCPRYLDGNPLPSFLHVCPACGFVGFEADYRAKLEPEKVESVKRVLAGLAWQENQVLGGPERYRRAALIGMYWGKKSAQIADLYLQATWCSRMDGEPEAEERGARKKAVKYFELALASEEFSDVDTPVVHYLLGELYRRLGDAGKARQHFSSLDNFQNVDKWLMEWRDKQAALLK